MALKTERVTIEAEGRDQGKVFELREMPAWQAERWGWRVSGVLARSGVDIPEPSLLGSLAVVAAFGFQAILAASYEDMAPLLTEMESCIHIVPDPQSQPQLTRPDIKGDIEEISTWLFLRDRVLHLHTGFSVAATLSNFKNRAASAQGDAADTIGSPATTQT